MDNSLKIGSLNVRGLNNRLKRKRVFRDMILNQYDLVLLQEVYSTAQSSTTWGSEWGGSIFYSHGASNARGVAILVKRNFGGKILEVVDDGQGRFIAIKIEYLEMELVIGNVYAPNKDTPEYFGDIWNKLQNMHGQQYIIGGDFNLVLDTDIDALNRITNNGKACDKIVNIMEAEELCDTFRVLNPNVRRYTCIF